MSSKIATYGSVTRHLELNYSNLIQNAKLLYRHFLGLGKTFFDGLVTLEMVPANLLNKSWPMSLIPTQWYLTNLLVRAKKFYDFWQNDIP